MHNKWKPFGSDPPKPWQKMDITKGQQPASTFPQTRRAQDGRD